ncbi:MAG: VWA domain-containing protein, partial [Tenericutes bacterium]|nr:VWA domain-containing protein [Mycoplasmatota bacterium]
MKKGIFFSIVVLLIFPLFVFATVYIDYDKAKSSTNTYITSMNKYKWYIDPSTNYLYNGSTFSTKTGFVKGGFLNLYEYKVSILGGKTYLNSQINYWTMTEKNTTTTYKISNNGYSESLNTAKIGAKITEYILKNTKVKGKGTYREPWEFLEPEFKIKVDFANATIIRNSSLTGNDVVGYNDTIVYTVEVKNVGEDISEVKAREIELVNAIGKTIQSPTNISVTLNGVAYSSTVSNNIVQSILSSNGYTFFLNPGATLIIKFNVKVIGNAGDVVSNQLVYSIDGVQPNPDPKNSLSIEKLISYSEIADNGANIVLALDDSGSMSAPKMNALKTAANQFIDTLMINDGSNYNNRLCIVTMNKTIDGTKKYKCTNGTTVTPQNLKTIISGLVGSGQTPYGTTLEDCYTSLQSLYNANSHNSNFVVFLSDGEPSSGSYTTQANNIKNYNGTKLYTIGFSVTQTAKTILENLATSPSYYYNASTVDVSSVFGDIARKISELTRQTVKGVVEISKN